VHCNLVAYTSIKVLRAVHFARGNTAYTLASNIYTLEAGIKLTWKRASNPPDLSQFVVMIMSVTITSLKKEQWTQCGNSVIFIPSCLTVTSLPMLTEYHCFEFQHCERWIAWWYITWPCCWVLCGCCLSSMKNKSIVGLLLVRLHTKLST